MIFGGAEPRPRPIVEPTLFAHRSFRLGNLGTLLFAAAFFCADPRQRRLPDLDLGLHRAPASAPRPCPAALSTVITSPRPASSPTAFGHRAVIVPGTLFFAAGVMVLRSAGATPDWLGLWLPGACLTGIGIGLAFPTLGSAAVRDIPDDRFATASAVNAAFRQVGAVLGTAILVAIVGEPATLQCRPQRRRRRLPVLGRLPPWSQVPWLLALRPIREGRRAQTGEPATVATANADG